MKLAKALMALLILSFALLLMSALVVCPLPEEAPEPADASPVRATLLPMALPTHEAEATIARADTAPRAALAPARSEAMSATAAPRARDANGRVLRDARYENSFYPVFRPEIAGG